MKYSLIQRSVSEINAGQSVNSRGGNLEDNRPQVRFPGYQADTSPIANHPPSGMHVVQRMPMVKMVTGITHLVKLTEGSLYKKDFKSNEVAIAKQGDRVMIDTSIRYRSRRGPNQEEFSETDVSGPQHYLWYKVISLNGVPQGEDVFIREDTITHPDQRGHLAAPLSLDIYGTANAEENEIRDAYSEGQRDFDCAFDYHRGRTYLLFRQFAIDRGPVRLIYKFRFNELEGASKELAQLARTPGVIIHTVMLHSLPDPPTATSIREALSALVLLARTYHCQVGLSNVVISGAGDVSELPSLVQQLRRKGIHLSVVENTMNPSYPDQAVVDYCRRNGIKYLAFGTMGPSSTGTCAVVPGSGVGDYQYLKDSEFEKVCRELHISKDQFRQVVLSWIRAKNISVITRSSTPGHRAENTRQLPVPRGFEEGIAPFGPPGDRLFPPLVKYLLGKGVEAAKIRSLSEIIGSGWLELYYKKVVVELHEDPLLECLNSRYHELIDAPGKNRWTDVTHLREWLGKIILGDRSVEARSYSAAQLLELGGQIYREGDEDFTLINTVTMLDDLPAGSGLVVMIKGRDNRFKKNADKSYRPV